MKAIFLAQQKLGEEAVPMGQVAKALGVVPGTATTMVKNLSQSGYVDYEPRRGVRLTEAGRQLGVRVLRRHRLVEYFLVETLGLDWGEIHEEADKLEHAVSDRVIDKLDAFLGYPKTDPHGDPIPDAEGVLDERKLGSLAECKLNHEYRISRITDQSSRFLQFADEQGLKPGAALVVRRREAVADSVSVDLGDGRSVNLGMKAAHKILVE